MDFLRSINPLWVTLAPILLINVYFFVTIFIFMSLRKKFNWQPPEYLSSRSTSRFLNLTIRHWWFWQMKPFTDLFVKLRVTPNMLTTIGFLINVLAAFFFSKGLFGYGGWCVAFGSTFDMFDGYVARATNQRTRSGAFFDSVMDRFSEGVVFLGLAFYFHSSWVLAFVVAGLIGGMLVSYTRARGEVLGIDVSRVGSMQRAERVVYICVSGIFEPVVTYVLGFWWFEPLPVLVIAAVCLIGVMANATAVYRMVYIMNALDKADKRGGESIPQILTQLGTKEGREQFWEKRRNDKLA